MSDFGDYLDEMARTRTSDAEIERLLSGAPGVGDDLQPLADLFAALRTDVELTNDVVAGYAAAAASSVGTEAASPVVAIRQGRPLFIALRRRVATVTAAAVVFFGGTSGLALAADGAKPGDALYGIDRAFEAIGIGAGAEQERLSEAEALVEVGEIQLGLEHAAETLEENQSNGTRAAEALREAAARVRDGGAVQSAATREGVAGLLAYLSEHTGDVDGAEVAELAQQIGGPGNRPSAPGSPETPGPPDDVPADPPGLSDRDPGPPDDVPADPPGLSDRETDPPTQVPADPPGLSDREPGPPDDVPADPPGLSDSKPGRPDPPRNEP